MTPRSLMGAGLAAWLVISGGQAQTPESADSNIALALADMLRAARAVVSAEQDRINNASIGDKGLSGDVVLERAVENFKAATGIDPKSVDPHSRFGRLLAAEMTAIRNVMREVQDVINQSGVGFKGFVPAVFGRMVTEHFQQIIGRDAEIKVTAPRELVRNRKALPDAWETEVIRTRLMSPEWEKGKVYAIGAKKGNRDAFRMLVPEYYTEGCLSCHGVPKGEVDITGYPKEGGKLGDLGGIISVTLYR
jgi:hypothetical protein